MAVHAQSSCTLSTITDVEAVYTYYYLASSTITVNEAPQDNVNPPGASTIIVVSGGNNYIWSLTEPSLNIINNVIQGTIGQLYVIECVLFSDNTYDWGPLMTSSTYAAAKAAYNLSSLALSQAQAANNATSLLAGHFIYRQNTSQSGLTVPSANVVQTVLKNNVDVTNDPTQWGYNVHIGSNGIRLRNNELTLSEWTSSALKFYRPGTGNVDAELNSNGLILSKGGIVAGDYTTNPTKFIYLSTEDYSGSPTITINGNSSGWRQIIGNKFGIKNDGTLYANNAVISGKIEVGAGSNVYTKDQADANFDALGAAADASYSVEIKVDDIDYVECSATLIAIPYYRGGILPNNINYTYQWYKDNIQNLLTDTYIEVTNPVDIDLGEYYELSNNEYILTSDSTIVSGKTYYIMSIRGSNNTILELGKGSDLAATYICVISK